MGMTAFQSIMKVERSAMPVIMAGIRLSAVYVIAWTSLASYIGRWFRDFILRDEHQADLIFCWTIPVTIMALLNYSR